MDEKIRNMENKLIAYNLQVWRISERERKKQRKAAFKEIRTKDFPELKDDMCRAGKKILLIRKFEMLRIERKMLK